MKMKKHKWPLQDQAQFLKKTGELLKRGYSISEAIESVSYQLPDKRKKELIQCKDMLKEGQPFHQMLQRLSFHPDLAGYVYFAEQHGNLAEAIQHGSEMILKRNSDLMKLRKLFYYPIFLGVITIFLFIFIDQTLLPRFTTLFKSMNLEANVFTLIILGIGRFLPSVLTVMCIFMIALSMFYFLYFRKLNPLIQKKILVSAPVIGNILRLLYTHYFCMQLSYLLKGGLSVFEALKTFEENKSQAFYSRIAMEIKTKLVTGEKLENLLKNMKVFEKDLYKIVNHGQQNSRLEQELYFYSQFCLGLLEGKIDRSLKTIQPIMYSFIGLLILSLYMAILLPMFHLLDGI